MDRIRNIFTPLNVRCLWKAILWSIGNIFFGLCPFIVVGVLYIFGLNENAANVAKHEFWHIINDGAVVFFCCAMMGAIAVDMFLARRHFRSLGYVIFVIVLAVFLLFCVVIVYVILLYGGTKGQGFRDLPRFQEIIVGISFVYIIFTKSSLLIKEKTKGGNQ